MYVYMCVYVFMVCSKMFKDVKNAYMHTYIYIHTYIHIRSHGYNTHTHICVRKHTQSHVFAHSLNMACLARTYAHTRLHTCDHVITHAYMPLKQHAHIRSIIRYILLFAHAVKRRHCLGAALHPHEMLLKLFWYAILPSTCTC